MSGKFQIISDTVIRILSEILARLKIADDPTHSLGSTGVGHPPKPSQ